MSPMHHYTAYGAPLASTIALPELDERPAGPARWTVTEADAGLPPMSGARALGHDTLYGTVEARLCAHDGGHRIEVDDTGAFDLSPDRTRVTVARRPGAWEDFVRQHLAGRVLATALYLDGLLPLHASAVATADGVLAFLAPKGYGKSSLALALAQAGAWLVSDDTLPVDPQAATALPGLQGLRVHDDSVAAVGAGAGMLRSREGKQVLTALPDGALTGGARPLAALYVLVPMAPETPALTRTPFPPALAAIGVVAHVKIGRMLGSWGAATMMARAAALVHRVPVQQLHVPRDLARLPAAAATLLAWHGRPA
ncbi:MAG: hypothetical protein K1X31_06790 [Gemmatimonadaceae bacterium]|nr:hypothetical protein [Gemmatimonadaceae bacterium]